MRPTRALHEAGQSLWLDNIRRGLLNDGTLDTYIDQYSITGLTSNPTIFDKAIESGSDYDAEIATVKVTGASDEEVFFELALTDLRRTADLFGPIHARSCGVDGWVSLEVSPLLAHDTAKTIAQATSLHAKAGRPNVFIKIPGTPEGLPAIEECIFAGIPINVTLLFSSEQYVASAEAYLRGIERREQAGLDPAVNSVASVFVSRWDTAVADRVPVKMRDRLGIAEAALAYRAYRELLDSPRWGRLANDGARPQRLLWASTSTKNPDAPDVLYVSALAAPFTINTMPEKTLHAFADHGHVGDLMTSDGGDAERTLAMFAKAGIDHHALADQLQREGEESFVKSWQSLLSSIAAKHNIHPSHDHDDHKRSDNGVTTHNVGGEGGSRRAHHVLPLREASRFRVPGGPVRRLHRVVATRNRRRGQHPWIHPGQRTLRTDADGHHTAT